MFRIFLIAVAVQLFPVIAGAQNTAGDSTRQLYEELQKQPKDSSKIKGLMRLGFYFIRKPGATKSHIDSGLVFFDQGAALAQQIKSQKWEKLSIWKGGEALYTIGDTTGGEFRIKKITSYYTHTAPLIERAEFWMGYGNVVHLYTKNHSAVITCYKNAISYYTQLRNPRKSLDAKQQIGIVFQETGKLKEAEIEFLANEQHYQALGYLTGLLKCQRNLATLYWLKGNIQRALYYHLEAVKSAKLLKNDYEISVSEILLGFQYFKLKMYKEALPYLEKSVDRFKMRKDQSMLYSTFLSNVVLTRIILKKTDGLMNYLVQGEKDFPAQKDLDRVNYDLAYGLAYDATGKTAEAEVSYKRMIKTFREQLKMNAYGIVNSGRFIQMCNSAVGNFYIKHQHFEKARPFFQEILQYPNAYSNPDAIADAQLAVFKIDSAAGKFLSAINHLQIHKKLHDSLYHATSEKQIEDLNAGFATEQRLKDIKLLKSQRDAQALAAQKATIQRNITIGGIAAVLILAGFAYVGYRNKKAVNRQLEEQQTKINHQNFYLQDLLAEQDLLLADKEALIKDKDFLLKEIHHRVKNNLQIIMSLLNSQSASLGNTAAVEAIKVSRNRVQAISLIHKKLYGADDPACVNIRSYISDLIEYLEDGFSLNQKKVIFEMTIDPLSVDTGQAVPIGLILNEAITNCIKYAFDDDGGKISLTLKLIDGQEAFLQIADNGRGLGPDANHSKIKSLGFNIMRGLGAQLKGTFDVDSRSGTVITVRFPLRKLHQVA